MNTPTAPPALRATGLGRSFRGGWALRDCDIDIPAGSVTALVGANGAGKSTLLQLAADQLRPTTGRIRVFGDDPGSPPSRERRAFLAQGAPLYPDLTVAETLRLGRELNAAFDTEAAERVVRAGDIAPRSRVGGLSAGQRSRVALAVVLARKAGLLLLDEPLADLDPLARHEITGLLMAEAAERQLTLVISSHVLAEVENVCDRVLLLHHGKVQLDGDVQELRDGHTLVRGRAHEDTPDGLPPALDRAAVVESSRTGRLVTALVSHVQATPGQDAPGGAAAAPFAWDPDRWETATPSVEELLLGRLRAARAADGARDGERSAA
ncbi:ABC transporter ATP-binding protein [Streptomyces sp. NRRL F-5126]|uniref:ABC transporter ATP-binding protein n=1 Tax=Streptomyces sp. NRRL F-5126 TaxID=1463857 RepID=UPI0004CC6108|nr:ABC transporter ATP-binding protein [Streptomyces sp. NRRL F-5126]